MAPTVMGCAKLQSSPGCRNLQINSNRAVGRFRHVVSAEPYIFKQADEKRLPLMKVNGVRHYWQIDRLQCFHSICCMLVFITPDESESEGGLAERCPHPELPALQIEIDPPLHCHDTRTNTLSCFVVVLCQNKPLAQLTCMCARRLAAFVQWRGGSE